MRCPSRAHAQLEASALPRQTQEVIIGVYAVTGSTSGIGHHTAQQLRDRGHTVIGIDVKGSDVIADLSTPHGRQTAAEGVLSISGGLLDGAVLSAGIGPGPGADRARKIAEANYFGVIELLNTWQSALAAGESAKVVVLASNSTTITPIVTKRTIRALLAGDVTGAERSVRMLGRGAAPVMYAASKTAVSRWVRHNAVKPEWAGRGIRLNALAPGPVKTPLLDQQLAHPLEGKAMQALPIPTGEFGDPACIADWIIFMLSGSAKFLCGSVIFVDGGMDAYFRAHDWPAAISLHELPRYLWRLTRYSKTQKTSDALS
ncbi:NAD(P)-dependent dehydrogenase (short-subunit alcohol dehydrogenase family) [Mycobacteroides chelonae]|nr:NAD(P)-dependent dehydrogenase (short-subunit alcohol dehydrogenase family) [Mycobacteroides chelonae]